MNDKSWVMLTQVLLLNKNFEGILKANSKNLVSVKSVSKIVHVSALLFIFQQNSTFLVHCTSTSFYFHSLKGIKM